jgi:hypothetical protein
MEQRIEFQKDSKPFFLEIDIEPKSAWQSLRLRLGLKPKKVVYKIDPLVIGTLSAVCKLILELKIDMDVLSPERINDEGPLMVQESHEAICTIIAMSISNRSGRYSVKCKQLISEQLTTQDLLKAMIVVRSQMHMNEFLATILSLKGINIMETTKK